MFSKEKLYHLYVVEQRTTVEIAKLAGVRSNTTVSNWLKKHNIAIRQGRDAQRSVVPTKEQLHELYVVQRKSIDTIAAELGSSEKSIQGFLKEHGIPIKSKTWKLGGHNKGKPMPEVHKRRLSQVAKTRIGMFSPRWGAILTKETKQKISKSLYGRFRKHLNPNWKDGGTTLYRRIISRQADYHTWRQQVFERDGYVCQRCRKPSSGDIQAHHIEPVRIAPERILDVNNGITLCKSCHRFVHGQEKKFAKMFFAILQAHHTTP